MLRSIRPFDDTYRFSVSSRARSVICSVYIFLEFSFSDFFFLPQRPFNSRRRTKTLLVLLPRALFRNFLYATRIVRFYMCILTRYAMFSPVAFVFLLTFLFWVFPPSPRARTGTRTRRPQHNFPLWSIFPLSFHFHFIFLHFLYCSALGLSILHRAYLAADLE